MAAAEAAFEGGCGEDSVEPLWLSFVDLSELHAQKGACYLDLGTHRQAEAALLEALRALRRDNPSHARDRAHYLSRLAKCHLLGGDLEQACAAGHQALDVAATIASARVVERIAEFHVSLAPHAGNGDVRTFRDRFSGHLRSQ